MAGVDSLPNTAEAASETFRGSPAPGL